MGIGDEIMVTGEIKRRAAGSKSRRFAVIDTRRGNILRQHEIWWGNPRIAIPGQPYDAVYANHGGARPYIEQKTALAWHWKAYTPEPGELFFRPDELAFGSPYRGYVVINPTIKDGASPNKRWRWEFWQHMVLAYPKTPWLQVGAGTDPKLTGVRFVETPTFRYACAVLAHSRAAVLHEGGLHHAAAALGVPSVVLYGGFISPKCTGYALHANLFTETKDYPLGCGMRIGCRHCITAMDSISPKAVLTHLEELLGQRA